MRNIAILLQVLGSAWVVIATVWGASRGFSFQIAVTGFFWAPCVVLLGGLVARLPGMPSADSEA